jgi:hypothetical protein
VDSDKSDENPFNARAEAQCLKERLQNDIAFLKENPEEFSESDLEGFLDRIEQEYSLYDNYFEEIIRHIGYDQRLDYTSILRELQICYEELLKRTPRHLRNLLQELTAQRRISLQLSMNLFSSRNTLKIMLAQFERTKRHYLLMKDQLDVCQKKIDVVINSSSRSVSNFQGYQQLYSMQRKRFYQNYTAAGVERDKWFDAVLSLSSFIQPLQREPSILSLETKRFELCDSINYQLSNWGRQCMNDISQSIKAWLHSFEVLAKAVVEDDKKQTALGFFLRNDMRVLRDHLSAEDEDMANIEANHPTLYLLHIFDTQSVVDNLTAWTMKLELMQEGYYANYDSPVLGALTKVESAKRAFVQSVDTFLTTCEEWTSGRAYYKLRQTMNELVKLAESYCEDVKVKSMPTLGIATDMKTLENQVQEM